MINCILLISCFCIISYNKIYYDSTSYLKQKFNSNIYDNIIYKLNIYTHSKLVQNKHLLNSKLLNNIDIVLSGGGFKNSYSMGIFMVINKLQKINKHIKINRFAGTSSGAQTSYLLINNELDTMIKMSYSTIDTLNKYPYARPKPFWEFFFSQMIQTYGVPDKNKLHMSVSKVNLLYPSLENKIISDFKNEDELLDSIMGTSGIPWFLINMFGYYRNMFILDGALTNNTPIFTDNKNDQLVINFDTLDEKYNKLFFYTKDELTNLIKKGIDDIIDLLNGKELDNIKILKKK